jgi:hypothetical protein
MKKFISSFPINFFLVCIVLMISLLLSCGGDTSAQQAGIGGAQYVPTHNHSGPLDGGTLNVPIVFARMAPATGTWTSNLIVPLNLADKDNMAWYNTGTYRYTPLQAGTYLFSGVVCGSGSTTLTSVQGWFKKSGTSEQATGGNTSASLTAGTYTCVSDMQFFNMNGSTDYVELWYYLNGTGTALVYGKMNAVRIAN